LLELSIIFLKFSVNLSAEGSLNLYMFAKIYSKMIVYTATKLVY